MGHWPSLTDIALDVKWLRHDVDLARYTVAYLLTCYMRGLDMITETENLFPKMLDTGTELYEFK